MIRNRLDDGFIHRLRPRFRERSASRNNPVFRGHRSCAARARTFAAQRPVLTYVVLSFGLGWTFLDRQYWGSAYNKSMKALMMDYAFQFVDNILFYIHEDNYRSQKAVEKLGGVRITQLDGIPLSVRPTANVIYRVQKDQDRSGM